LKGELVPLGRRGGKIHVLAKRGERSSEKDNTFKIQEGSRDPQIWKYKKALSVESRAHNL